MTIAENFSEFLINTTFDELPEQAVDHAAMIVASTLASAACGRHINSSRIVSDIEMQRGGTPEASVWFEMDVKLPVIGAARANALMSDAAASDDSDLRNIVHAGTPLTAAALAAAGKKSVASATPPAASKKVMHPFSDTFDFCR